MSYACVVLYRSPMTGQVFAESIDKHRVLVEFPNRDAAIAFVEQELAEGVPYQIVELDEL